MSDRDDGEEESFGKDVWVSSVVSVRIRKLGKSDEWFEINIDPSSWTKHLFMVATVALSSCFSLWRDHGRPNMAIGVMGACFGAFWGFLQGSPKLGTFLHLKWLPQFDQISTQHIKWAGRLAAVVIATDMVVRRCAVPLVAFGICWIVGGTAFTAASAALVYLLFWTVGEVGAMIWLSRKICTKLDPGELRRIIESQPKIPVDPQA